jgi:hypothetical protein
MFRNAVLTLTLFTLLLAACAMPGGTQPTEMPVPTETPERSPTAPPTEPPTPTPDLDEPVTGEPDGEVTPSPQPWVPLPEDEDLDRGNAFVETSDLLILESFPVQIMLNLAGSLPTPCHQLRLVVAEPDDQNQIAVDVYSLVDPEQVCTQNLAPFEANVPLGSFPSGDYTVLVNGEVIGEFTA